MSTVSMTFGRPARHSAQPLIERVRHGFETILELPRRLDAWMEARDQANMTASDVMALASRIEDSDPGFAADLRGAAMRAVDLH